MGLEFPFLYFWRMSSILYAPLAPFSHFTCWGIRFLTAAIGFQSLSYGYLYFVTSQVELCSSVASFKHRLLEKLLQRESSWDWYSLERTRVMLALPFPSTAAEIGIHYKLEDLPLPWREFNAMNLMLLGCAWFFSFYVIMTNSSSREYFSDKKWL